MKIDPAYLRFRIQQIEQEKARLSQAGAGGRGLGSKEFERVKVEEEALLQELRARDREVRAHEEAHLLAAGPYARSGPRFETVRGPDGREYAVAGEVEIDTSPVPGDPEKTLEKARVVKRAALAPTHPSAQDLKVAAQADRLAQEALFELMKQRLASETQSNSFRPSHREVAHSYQAFATQSFEGLDL